MSYEFISSVIQGFFENLPYMIESFMNLMINYFASPQRMIRLAVSFTEALIKSIPKMADAFVDGIADGLKDAFGGLFGGGGGGGIPIISDIGGIFGFAKGGLLAKGGIPGMDSIPARLTPGELVVDKQTTDALKRDIKDTNVDVTNALLSKVIYLLEKPQEISTSVNFNNRTLADIILNLNRTNVRLA